MPSRPRSPSSGHSSRGKRLSRSMSAASGAMRSRGELRHGGAQGVDVFAEAEVEIFHHADAPSGQACESCPIVRQSDQVSMNRTKPQAQPRPRRAAAAAAAPAVAPARLRPRRCSTRSSGSRPIHACPSAIEHEDPVARAARRRRAAGGNRSRAAVPRASLDGARSAAAARERGARSRGRRARNA